MMSVVLFRRVVDDFKTAARVRGFQVGAAAVAGHGLSLPLAAAPAAAALLEMGQGFGHGACCAAAVLLARCCTW